jgi:hypothetical protein
MVTKIIKSGDLIRIPIDFSAETGDSILTEEILPATI